MHSRISIHKQNGAVLLVSLIILLIMTVIGTSGITSVTLEERMVSNMYDDNLSFQASETGLRDCEGFLAEQENNPKKYQEMLLGGVTSDTDTWVWDADEPESGAPTANAPGSVWTGATGLDFWWQDPQFWADKAMEYSKTDDTQTNMAALAHGAVAANPRCIREEVAFQADDKERSVADGTGWYLYQATAAASGGDVNSTSVVQSAYFKRYK